MPLTDAGPAAAVPGDPGLAPEDATRAAAATAFLSGAGWGAARRAALAGDASARRYERLTAADGDRAVLMDAPPGCGDDTAAFVAIARHLAALGLSPPAILAEDHARGFLLIEDLGDGLFARLLRDDAAREPELYAAAAAVLAELHRHPPPPGLPRLDAATMPALIAPAFDWYAAHAAEAPAPDASAAIAGALAEALDRLAPVPRPVLILRDYHAENLIWLPDRHGTARVGLLDFQLAHEGHPAYDLVSLVEDARRDVSEAGRAAAIGAYLEATGAEAAQLEAAMAVQGAQRNLRILGIFARLSLQHGKPQYVDLIPRVWGHVRRDLAHPALTALARAAQALPPPTPAVLSRLKDRCGTIPAR